MAKFIKINKQKEGCTAVNVDAITSIYFYDDEEYATLCLEDGMEFTIDNNDEIEELKKLVS